MSELVQQENKQPLAMVLANPEALKEIPIDTVRELVELQERIEDREARRAFYESFTNVQSEIRPVVKQGFNSHTRSNYAKLEDVQRMLEPIISRHGFSQSVSTEDSPHDGHTRYVLLVRHNLGHSERHTMDAPVDDVGTGGKTTKTRIHGMGSSYKYSKRYLICNVWDIPLVDEGDDDGNAAGGVGPSAEKISDGECHVLDDLLLETKADRDKFLSFFGIKSIGELPINRYKEAVNMLEAKKKMQSPEQSSFDDAEFE